jgi:penicillin-binding protein 2
VSPEAIKYLQTALQSVSVNGTAAGVFNNWPKELPIAAKTGTGSVQNKQSTSWFATYGPGNDPQYAVVMMVSQGGTGSGTSGPSVRKIYEALLGVDENGKYDPATALLPHPSAELPRFAPDGSVVPVAHVLPAGPAAPAPVPAQTVLASPGALPPDRPAYHGGSQA